MKDVIEIIEKEISDNRVILVGENKTQEFFNKYINLEIEKDDLSIFIEYLERLDRRENGLDSLPYDLYIRKVPEEEQIEEYIDDALVVTDLPYQNLIEKIDKNWLTPLYVSLPDEEKVNS